MEWHKCYYDETKLQHDGTWRGGKWYVWRDKYGNEEVARMKEDAIDHFLPPAKIIEHENIVAFREIEPSGEQTVYTTH